MGSRKRQDRPGALWPGRFVEGEALASVWQAYGCHVKTRPQGTDRGDLGNCTVGPLRGGNSGEKAIWQGSPRAEGAQRMALDGVCSGVLEARVSQIRL